jgi:hypothetical protein
MPLVHSCSYSCKQYHRRKPYFQLLVHVACTKYALLWHNPAYSCLLTILVTVLQPSSHMLDAHFLLILRIELRVFWKGEANVSWSVDARPQMFVGSYVFEEHVLSTGGSNSNTNSIRRFPDHLALHLHYQRHCY